MAGGRSGVKEHELDPLRSTGWVARGGFGAPLSSRALSRGADWLHMQSHAILHATLPAAMFPASAPRLVNC